MPWVLPAPGTCSTTFPAPFIAAAWIDNCCVAVLTGVPVDPRGRLSRSWRRLVHFTGDDSAWNALARSMAETKMGEPLALWHMVGDSCVLVRARPEDPIQWLLSALQNTGTSRAPNTLSEPPFTVESNVTSTVPSRHQVPWRSHTMSPLGSV